MMVRELFGVEVYFNPRPPCGGRRAGNAGKILGIGISIHVPRVEDDDITASLYERIDISIHVPRVEDDPQTEEKILEKSSFQSTSPVWRTTLLSTMTKLCRPISIHVPRVEDDAEGIKGIIDTAEKFQSTSPVWRTTRRAK